MSKRLFLSVLSLALALIVAQGCSDSGDDGCPACQPLGGSSPFPPTAPIIEGQPPPTTGGTSSGGTSSFGGSATDGLGGTFGGTTGGLGATGGVIATGGTQGGTFTGGFGGF